MIINIEKAAKVIDGKKAVGVAFIIIIVVLLNYIFDFGILDPGKSLFEHHWVQAIMFLLAAIVKSDIKKLKKTQIEADVEVKKGHLELDKAATANGKKHS